MKTIYFFIISILISLQGLFMSCNQDINNFVENVSFEEKEVLLSDAVDNYKYRIIAMGLDTTSIYEWNGYYVVEGDILIPKDSLDVEDAKTRQYRSDYYAFNEKVYTIGVNNTISTTTEWRQVVEEVISIYNANTGFRLRYKENNPDITISRVNNLPLLVCAQAVFPSSIGRPGSHIYINYGFVGNIDTSLDFSQKVFLIMHEVGHTLGLRHTNESGNLIPGTPTSDPNSFMNSGTCGHLWEGFSNFDLVALNYLWPYRCFVLSSNGGAYTAVIPNSPLDRSVVSEYPSGIFSGWYKDSGFTIPWNYDTDRISEDIILYSKWRYHGGVGRIETSSHVSSSISFTVSETTGVTLTARVGKGLNEWWEISPYPNGTYAIVGRTSSVMKRIDMAPYIWHMNPETYIEHTENIVLDAGTHWLAAGFPLPNQSGASGKHGITYAIINK